MQATDLIADALDRVKDTVHTVLDGLDEDHLTVRIDPDANTIAWLIWHLTRVQDDHLADVAGSAQVWTTDGWSERFGLPLDDSTIGYGHRSDEVAAVEASAELLGAYHDAVNARSHTWLQTLGAQDLGRIVDDRWDPPVPLAVRLVSVVEDTLQHVGQAAYVRGVLKRSAG